MHDQPGVRTLERAEWAALRAAETVPIHDDDLARLRGINEELDMTEVADIYLPLARLVHLRAGVTRNLHDATGAFFGRFGPSVPFVIGLAGSVAVGKSTAARVLAAMLARAPDRRHVEIVTTDGFLHPNAVLKERGIMNRKGFPESYDTGAIVRFLVDVKSGRAGLTVPIYDHGVYDVLPDRRRHIGQPSILILEGLNVLQTPPSSPGQPNVFVSDFFDFTIYVDAPEPLVRAWYIERFRTLRAAAADDPSKYFYAFRDMTDDEADAFAEQVWETINLPNLVENVQPTRDRAELVLEKGAAHRVERVHLRTR